MKQLINNIKKYALKFSIIGVLNTVIHMVVYNLLIGTLTVVLSQIIAFVVASIFSYFANAKVTYNKEAEMRTFSLVVLVFGVRLILNALLAYGFEQALIFIQFEQFIPLIPIMITAVLLPLQFITFNIIFDVHKQEVMEDSV